MMPDGRHAPRDRTPPDGGRGPLGELLHAARRASGDTMTVVGERCGMASGYLSYIERGKVVQPGPGQCERLAEGYGVPLGQIQAAVEQAVAARWPADAGRVRVSRDLYAEALADAIRYRTLVVTRLEALPFSDERQAAVSEQRALIIRYEKARSAMNRVSPRSGSAGLQADCGAS